MAVAKMTILAIESFLTQIYMALITQLDSFSIMYIHVADNLHYLTIALIRVPIMRYISMQ